MATERIGRTIKEKVIGGVVDRIENDCAGVILDAEGEDDYRYMSRSFLADSNVNSEGQSFSLHIREYEYLGNIKTEVYVELIGDLNINTRRQN
jgi:hypothetical protein